jgi:uncharacterized membrane protein
MKQVFEKVKAFFVAMPGVLKKIDIRKINWVTILSFLSYLNILALVSFAASKNMPFVRFHAKQGLVLLAFFGIAMFSFYVPFLFWIVALFYAVYILLGIINSFRGSERHLPLIGRLADKI